MAAEVLDCRVTAIREGIFWLLKAVGGGGFPRDHFDDADGGLAGALPERKSIPS
jgi:hypothetical protein